MPLTKGGRSNKAQRQNAIMKSLSVKSVLTNAQERELERVRLPKELVDIYENMHSRR